MSHFRFLENVVLGTIIVNFDNVADFFEILFALIVFARVENLNLVSSKKKLVRELSLPADFYISP